MKLAIDFGTTNTVIAALNDGIQIMPLPGLSAPLDTVNASPPLIPSLVYVRQGAGDVAVGQAVREQALEGKHDNRLFRSFKRGIVSQPAPEPRSIDGAWWGDRQAGEVFLRTLLDALPKGQIEQLALTAPIAAFEGYLAWLDGILGGLASDQVYIVDEATAAALGYAVTEPGTPVMVFDFGGGTLDLSLVQLPENREHTGGILSRLRRGNASHSAARIIAKAGRVIGGSDIDHWLLAWALERLNLTPADLGSGYAALLTACERAKIRLSTDDETTITVEARGETYPLRITRADLEALLAANGFYDALRLIVDKVMRVAHRSGMFKEDVKHVLLVGGVSLMPSVQAALKAYFGESAVRADKPFTAVAEGALQVAAGTKLDGYVSQSYGLRYLDLQTCQHRCDEIVPIGSRYPTEMPVEIELAAARDGQNAVEFVIGEISAESGAMVEARYEGGQTVFVARADGAAEGVVYLNEAHPLRVPLDPPAKAGDRRLRARFGVDDRQRLRLSVTDLKTRRTLLTNAVVVPLGAPPGRTDAVGDEVARGTVGSGYEPALADAARGRRLSLRGMATMFNALPPEAISLEAAEAALRGDAFGPRYSAAITLSKRGDRDARSVMRRVLTDGGVPARASAARHLDGFTWYAAEPLFHQALADPDERVREAAIACLSGLRTLDAYRLMADSLQGEVDGVREAAAVGLHDCQDAAAVPVLKVVLSAGDPDVRVKALEALSNNDTPDALPVVRAALDDPLPEVAYAAALSLLELVREDALEELAARIAQTQGEAREALLRGFFHATNYLIIDPAQQPSSSAVFAALEAALGDALPDARMAAVWSLAKMRDERATALLLRAFEEDVDGAVRAHILRAAAGFAAPVTETLLRAALASPDPQVRAAADLIIEFRERAGGDPQYDEAAALGIGFSKPSRRVQ